MFADHLVLRAVNQDRRVADEVVITDPRAADPPPGTAERSVVDRYDIP